MPSNFVLYRRADHCLQVYRSDLNIFASLASYLRYYVLANYEYGRNANSLQRRSVCRVIFPLGVVLMQSVR